MSADLDAAVELLSTRHMVREDGAHAQLVCDCGWHCPRPSNGFYSWKVQRHWLEAALEDGEIVALADYDELVTRYNDLNEYLSAGLVRVEQRVEELTEDWLEAVAVGEMEAARAVRAERALTEARADAERLARELREFGWEEADSVRLALRAHDALTAEEGT